MKNTVKQSSWVQHLSVARAPIMQTLSLNATQTLILLSEVENLAQRLKSAICTRL